MQGNGYTIGFAAAVCVACSLLLSGVSGALKPQQDKNRVLDRQKNILVALGWAKTDVDVMTGEQVQSTYKTGVKELVVDRRSGGLLKKEIGSLPPKTQKGEEKTATELPLYKRVDDASKLAFAYPVTGKGLWSTLYGYLAVKPSGNEIVGLTFYKHGETPGLGAEIEQVWFRQNFVGKELYEGKKLVGIEVVKGKAADKPSFKANADHMVDGISGATLTGNGVMKMTKIEPQKYSAFFKNRLSAPKPAPKPVRKPPPPPPPTREDVPGEAPLKAPVEGSSPTTIVIPPETDVSKKGMGHDAKLVPAGLNKEQLEQHMKENFPENGAAAKKGEVKAPKREAPKAVVPAAKGVPAAVAPKAAPVAPKAAPVAPKGSAK